MNRLFILLSFFLPIASLSQKEAGKLVRAFPITLYIVDLSDSVKIVQVNLPEGVKIAGKQVGHVKGNLPA